MKNDNPFCLLYCTHRPTRLGRPSDPGRHEWEDCSFLHSSEEASACFAADEHSSFALAAPEDEPAVVVAALTGFPGKIAAEEHLQQHLGACEEVEDP